jgi:hypothetical protein
MAATDGWALSAGRAIAAGRIAAGLALLLAPGRVSRAWVGDHGPAGEVLTRCVGIRDLVMGGIAMHTVDHPQVGPRWVATCALADAVDGLASYAARRALPPAGAIGVPVAAAGSAVVGFAAAVALRGRAKRSQLGPQAPITVVPKNPHPVHPVPPGQAA